ncbi:hypothetical protein QL285_019791 [Trifolium repens]|nr:hypothetical protein QL285_019791 [Trifolium repens]
MKKNKRRSKVGKYPPVLSPSPFIFFLTLNQSLKTRETVWRIFQSSPNLLSSPDCGVLVPLRKINSMRSGRLSTLFPYPSYAS